MLVITQYTYLGTEYGLTDDELSEANILQIAYHPDWLNKMILKGKIREIDKERILQMVEMLESTYPGLWDIQVSKSKWIHKLTYENFSNYGAKTFEERRVFHKLCFDIIIRFPEVKIKNSKSNTIFHTMKDLYVKFQYHQIPMGVIYNGTTTEQNYLDLHPEIMEYAGFYQQFKEFNIGHAIYGLRETLSEAEYRANYHHSHLNTLTDMRWSGFCLGTGEIGQTLLLLESDFIPDLFQMAIYQLEAYIAWESLEGRPYKKFATVNEVSGAGLTSVLNISEYNIEDFFINVRNYWSNLKRDQPLDYESLKPKFNWKITNNKPELIIDGEIDKFFKIYGNRAEDYPIGFIYYQDREGKYYDVTVNNTPVPINLDNLTKNTIVFRGEVKKFKLTEVIENSEISSEFIFHPKLKELLKQKFEAYGNNNRVREGITHRANQIILARKAAKQNQIPLPENQ